MESNLQFLDNVDDPVNPEFLDYDRARVVVLPVPYEESTTYQKGTKNAPVEILKASSEVELFDPETGCEVLYEVGIHTRPVLNLPASGCSDVINAIKTEVYNVIDDGKFPVVLGGEHTVTLGVLNAVCEFYSDSDLTVVQLDAHADLREVFEGSRYNHACVMRRVLELGMGDINVVQFGVRSMSLEEASLINVGRVSTFLGSDMHESDPAGWFNELEPKIRHDVYLTIDSDFFDWEVMRATGTPEPGGISWYDGLKLIKDIFRERNVVGADIVEICPDAVGDIHSQFAAAKLVYKLVGYKFCLRT